MSILTEDAKEPTSAPKDQEKAPDAKGDGKPAEQTKAEGEKKAEAPKTEPPKVEPKVAPEKYDLKLPEGSLLEPTALDRIAKLAKERGLSNEDAQKELDRDNDTLKAYVEGQKAQLKKESETWLKECEADKEFGGEKFKESAEYAKRVLKWADESGAFGKVLDETGFGDHPVVFRVFAKLGRAFKEDKVIHAGETPAAPKTLEERLYGPKE